MDDVLTTGSSAVRRTDAADGRTGARALSVRNVSKRFGVVQALQDVSIELRPGEIHALVGENGSGKSTLVKIVAGAVGADSGSVEIGGRPLTPATPGRADASAPTPSSRTDR